MPTRPTNPRLLTNPSHQHKCLLIYCHCRYFLIFPLLTYCCPRYIIFAQDGGRKGGVAEPKVIQKQLLMKYATVATVVFGLYMTCTILVLYWPNIGTILYFVIMWILYYWFVIGWPRVRLALRENGEKHGKIQPNSYLFILLFFAQNGEQIVI